ncbi:MAG: polysaccharide deacetylase family protein [Bacillota bacterium]
MKEKAFNFLINPNVSRITLSLSRKKAFKNIFTPITVKDNSGKGLVTVSFDIDYEKDVLAIPKVLELLEKHKIKASFACVGIWAKRYPEIHRDISNERHEITNHSFSHPDNIELNLDRFAKLSKTKRMQEIVEGNNALEDVLGKKIIGFRTPHFGNQHVFDVYNTLMQIGYKFSSSVLTTNNYGLCNIWLEKESNIIEIPVSTIPFKPWASFDSWNYFNKRKPLMEKGRNMVEDFAFIIQEAIKNKSYANFYFDPADFSVRNEYLHICKILNKSEQILIQTYEEICSKLLS